MDLRQLIGLPSSSPAFCLCYVGQTPSFVLFNQSGAQRQWNLVDTLSLSFGRHQFKFGADYRRLAPFAVPPNPEVQYFYGFINGEKFVVMDLGANDVLQTASQHDAEMKRPVPLQVLASSTAGSYRLYIGRDYVEFRRAP